jgi:Fur family ferric uptake transcriptional regulator
MSERLWSDAARSALRAAGYRSGGARDAVVGYLAARDCCVSAQELHDGLRADGRRVGIASVYRALDQLGELQLVHRVDLGDGVARFEAAQPDGEHHHHVVCDDCGRVEQFSDHALESRLTSVAGGLGFDLAEHDVVLRGSCPDCRVGERPAGPAPTFTSASAPGS